MHTARTRVLIQESPVAEERPKKKVVQASSAPAGTAAAADGPRWAPTAEAKGKAVRLRIFAAVLWVLAIAGEAFAIFWVLKQNPPVMWLLIVLIVVIGVLAVAGAFLWKKANDLDPASKQDKVRFFVQNQLGVIIAMIAFIPLIVLIFTNKNMSGGQKALAGVIGIVVLLAAGALSADYTPPSVEQYTGESNLVQDITGADQVYWTKSGDVFHLCEQASAVNKESKDNQILTGTVAQAHADGKPRLTYQLPQELKECGYTDYQLPANWRDVVDGKATLEPAGTDATPEPATTP